MNSPPTPSTAGRKQIDGADRVRACVRSYFCSCVYSASARRLSEPAQRTKRGITLSSRASTIRRPDHEMGEETELIKDAEVKETSTPISPVKKAPLLPLWAYMLVYIATALMQPTLTDEIRYSGGGGHVGFPPTLLATLSNTVAMSSLLVIAPGGFDGLRRIFSNRASAGRVLICTALDFVSGCLLTTGLLMVGGGMFVVVYASTTVWTALWARWSGQHLSAGRWAGVLLVFAGMVLNSSQGLEQAAAESVAASTLLVLGLCAVVVGTMLHAAMFVYSELAIKQAQIDLLLLCAGMGLLESVTLSLWNLLLLATMGTTLYRPEEPPARDASSRELCLLYAGLTVINAVHAWAFFNMLEKVGAVSSAVMKGLQLVLVFAFSVTFFCQMQATQCFTWSKATGVGVVALGLLVYAHSTATAASAKRKQTMS